MKKNRAIPEGFMTVGEAAKKMGVTVRTLQYYDEEGILSPSVQSEGGRRLYTDKDVIKLYQILTMKSLGFSLNDIKNRLISLDSPADVADALSQQAEAIRTKIKSLSEALMTVEALRVEALQMQSVDFKKYADIIVNLQMKNEMYWAIKNFDDDTLTYMRSRFDKEGGIAFMDNFKRLCGAAVQYKKDNIAPESEDGLELAKAFWNLLMEFTGGDLQMLPRLMGVDNCAGPDGEWNQNQAIANSFIEPALAAYFSRLGYNPMEVGHK